MRLYDIPRGSKLRLNTGLKEELVTFHHPDGLYSYCTIDSLPEGENELHVSIVASMKMCDDGVWELQGNQEEDETDLPTKDPK